MLVRRTDKRLCGRDYRLRIGARYRRIVDVGKLVIEPDEFLIGRIGLKIHH